MQDLDKIVCLGKWYSGNSCESKIFRESTIGDKILPVTILSAQKLETSRDKLMQVAHLCYLQRLSNGAEIYKFNDSNLYRDLSVTLEYFHDTLEMIQISSIGLNGLINAADELELPRRHLIDLD